MSQYFLPDWDDSWYDLYQPASWTGVKRKITLPWGEVTLDMSLFQAAVVAVAALGVKVPCRCNGIPVRPEFLLLEWFNDADNLELMNLTYTSLPPEEAVQHDVFYWMSKAVRDVFNVNTEMVWDMSREVMLKHIKAGHAMHIEATDEPNYLALVGYDSTEDEFITREGCEHCCQIDTEFPNNLTNRAIAYWI
ncbi:MAG: hypothetical protein HKM05_00805 [Spirochaetales bacterium]|nr:hypothetical protein [Spirochaetales bacterium]